MPLPPKSSKRLTRFRQHLLILLLLLLSPAALYCALHRGAPDGLLWALLLPILLGNIWAVMVR